MSLFSKKHKFEEYSEMKEFARLKMMNTTDPDECRKWADLLSELERMEEKKKRPFGRVSPDTIVQVLGSLAGVGIICSYEHLHVLASKALPFVIKLR